MRFPKSNFALAGERLPLATYHSFTRWRTHYLNLPLPEPKPKPTSQSIHMPNVHYVHNCWSAYPSLPQLVDVTVANVAEVSLFV